MNLKIRKKEDAIWIIRYIDGALESYHGTRKSAETIAEKKKDLHGGSYIII